MGFDAVFVGAGAGAPSFLGIPGEFAGQVYSANEFLTRVNLMGGDKFPYLDTPIGLGDSVVVIGAGNTAMDCLRVAKRLGAPTRALRLPPLRGRGAGAHRGAAPRQGRGRRVLLPARAGRDPASTTRATCAACGCRRWTLGEPDETGRRKPVPLGEFVELDCDTVIYALGTKANPIVGQATPGLGLNKWGYIVADDGDAGDQPARRLRRRRHRHRRRDRDPGDGRRTPRRQGDRRLPPGDRKRKWPINASDVAAFVPPTALPAMRRHRLGRRIERGSPTWT